MKTPGFSLPFGLMLLFGLVGRVNASALPAEWAGVRLRLVSSKSLEVQSGTVQRQPTGYVLSGYVGCPRRASPFAQPLLWVRFKDLADHVLLAKPVAFSGSALRQPWRRRTPPPTGAYRQILPPLPPGTTEIAVEAAD